jgi:GAF domain-containing protein/nitrogen-specific signal transduction histidine kinase
MTAPSDDTTTDLRAVIAALQAERDAALSGKAALAEALARRNSEFGERIEYQAATIDVLKAMSASPSDPQPVFDLIVERARDLCNAYGVTVLEFDGGLLHYRAANGISDDAETREAFAAMYPRPPTRDMPQGRAILDRRTIRIDDLEADPGLNPFYRGITAKSTVVVPLMRGEVAIGTVGIGGRERGGFSESQIEILKTFAEQAVIAITSAETYRALQTRTSDLQETLEYQTAISDLLKVISRSTFDLQPVLDTVVETAAKLCVADMAHIGRREGEVMHFAANYGFSPEYETHLKARGSVKLDPGSPTIAHRTLIEGHLVHIDDVTAVPGYPEVFLRLGKHRTSLGVPLLRDGETIGFIQLSRQRVEPFTDRQIELVSTFADQAVIAIENTRLITEQREALEQQTATAEVLQAINANPGNLTPVFEAMLENAMRLCGAAFGELYTFDKENFTRRAHQGVPAAFAEVRMKTPADAPGSMIRRLREGANVLHIADVKDDELYRIGDPMRVSLVDLGGARTVLTVALRKDESLLGFIGVFRQEVRPFSDRQIALLQNFGAQAVIAMENARLLTEQREALEQQTATAEVLQVINASPGNLTPVFEAMLEKAIRLCGGDRGVLWTIEGGRGRLAAARGLPAEFVALLRERGESGTNSPLQRVVQGERLIEFPDTVEEFTRSGDPHAKGAVEAGVRSAIWVAIVKEGVTVGAFAIGRSVIGTFSDKQIALLQNFAAQAVIAMENARLLTEQREALEQQTATAEVLQVINASPGNLEPVFDAMLEKAMRLCGAAFGLLYTYDGELLHTVAHRGVPTALAEFRTRHPPSARPGDSAALLIETKRPVHLTDMMEQEFYRAGDAINRATVDLGGARTTLTVPLLKDDALLGVISIYRQEVRPFSDKQIALLENFAAQAVIAMENARLLNELRARTDELAQRQAELRITFENMGDGVAMFDETQYLAAWNRKFQDILDLPDTLLEQHRTYEEHLLFLAARGDFGPGIDTVEQINELVASTGQPYGYERTRPDGRVIEIRRNPVPDGGFVLIYSDITERKRSEEEIRAARDAAETTLRELRTAQANLIQAEKMASLGQLTAGIAHEIKNPLNFVNNFAALSVDLLSELKETAAPGFATLTNDQRTEIEDVSAMLTSNLEKITEHGKRADGIVKAMLEHSRGSSGERRTVDLNALIDDALNLAYHGARAQDQSFNITLDRDFGVGIAPIEVNPQDITRVFLNIFSNGFYAAMRRAREGGDAGLVPTLKVATIDGDDAVEIRVRDNGTGIPADIRDKLFQPFFTTKPTGEGTGLGLSITYDIVTQQHGGSIAVDSNVGEYSEFTIRLPRKP